MERLWSLAVATGGNRWQMLGRGNRHKQAKTVAAGCDQLPQNLDGKEGVDGFESVRGLPKSAANGAFSVEGVCTISSMRCVWSPLWSFQVQSACSKASKMGAFAGKACLNTRPRPAGFARD
jgi:hypothetical protein